MVLECDAMKPILSGLAAGMIFGTGIAVSGMGNPAKVLNFFDILGTWDPSLAFVMGGALLVAAIGYRVVFAYRTAPLFDARFHLPTSKTIDAKLIGGSAVFGVGWGISGFCPGGAIPALGFAPWPTALFLFSMAGGILIARYLQRLTPARTA
jgi:uncharacterized protein